MKVNLVCVMCCICLAATAIGQQKDASSVLNSWGDDPGMIYLTGRGTADGRMFEYKVELAALKGVPAWMPDRTDPPLSIPEAIAIAKRTALSDYPRFKELQLGDIEVLPVASPAVQNQWFYVISLNPVVEKLTVYDSDITVVMLMNGFVVKPKLRKKRPTWSGESWTSPPSEGDLQKPEGNPAIQASQGKFVLVRRGKDCCALLISASAGDPNRAEYDAYYQPDGSGDFAAATVVATHGSVHEGGGDSDLYIRCGPFRVQWSFGNWLYWLGFKGLADFQIASTPWSRREDIRVSDPSLQWHGLPKSPCQ